MNTSSNFPSFQFQRELVGHQGRVNFVKFNVEGGYCLSGGTDNTVKLWNPHTGALIKTYTGHNYEVLNISLAQDNSKFCTCSADKSTILWDVGTGKPIRRFSGHSQRVNDVDFNEETTIIASASYDSTVRLWDTRSRDRHPIQLLEDAKDSVTSVEFYQHLIMTSSIDGSIRVYDIRAGTLTTDLVGHPITCASFSSDSKCILVSSLDSTIRLFDRENGTMLAKYSGHVNKNYRIESCLSNTDSHVLSGSEDGQIFIWDLVEPSISRSFVAHERAVLSLDYHPKQDMILSSSSANHAIKVWDVPRNMSSKESGS